MHTHHASSAYAPQQLPFPLAFPTHPFPFHVPSFSVWQLRVWLVLPIAVLTDLVDLACASEFTSWVVECPKDTAFPSTLRTAYGTYNFPPFFCDLPQPCSWGRSWCKCLLWGWALNWHLFSAFWPVRSFCTNYWALQRSFSGWGKAALIFGCKHNYLDSRLIIHCLVKQQK